MFFNQPPDSASLRDICIIGSGPVGMAFALECAALGLSVVVLEAGNLTEDTAKTEAARAEVVGPFGHAPMNLATRRAFGGTSWLWGGRCVPFDDNDFAARTPPETAWPLTHDDVRPWYPSACRYLACGDAHFSAPAASFSLGPAVSTDRLERWSTEPKLARLYRSAMERSPTIAVHLDCTVIDLAVDPVTGIVSAVVANRQKQYPVTARHIVLAAGGLETTRLLLATQVKRPHLFGGADGVLGRFYMGHLSGKIANLVLSNPCDIADFDFFKDESGTYVRRRLILNADIQAKENLLNTAFWPDNMPFHDAKHRSSVLSAAFLALAIAPLGRRLLPEAIRLAHLGGVPRDYPAHVRNILRGGPQAVRDIADILHKRLFAKPRKPGFLIKNKGGRYALHYHAEQAPNADSRVTLGEGCDPYGVPRLKIDLRYSATDAESVIRSHALLDSQMRARGNSHLDYSYPSDQLFDAVMRQAGDGFHQIGTTRMGEDPATSIVDGNLKVHGLPNLFIACSSVLPTAGQANPTLLTTALAMRLAHHLHSGPQGPGGLAQATGR